MDTEALAQRLRVVLAQTSHPGNIGAAARAMKTMGLAELHLVAPRRFPDPEAQARASGADDILAAARVHAALPDALAGCSLVIGTTARERHLSAPVLDPRDAARRILALPEAACAALLFGQERTGLTNEQIDHCHYLVRIPANPGYSSLNLAAAVQVLAYELRMSALAGDSGMLDDGSDGAHAPATADEMEQFYQALQALLERTGFLDPDNPRHLMRRLRRLYNRAAVDRNEYNILRGIIVSVEKKLEAESGQRADRE